jgi:hypothetical protein
MGQDRPWIAEILNEIEQHDRTQQQNVDDLQTANRRRRSAAAGSVVYSLRLDPLEVEALERRAKQIGIGPTVLARNLIRIGLVAGTAAELADAVRRASEAIADIRGCAS